MIKRGRHIIKSHMTFSYDFTGIRLQEGCLTPVDWTLTADLVATGKKGKTREEIEDTAGFTYQKIYFWLDTNLPNILMVDVGTEDDLYIANLSSNLMMYCPGNPSDDTLIQLLHSKISVLAGTGLIVGEMKLKGSDTSLEYTFDCSDGDYELPTTTEYYTESTTRDKIPWWARDDGFCFEFVRPIAVEGTPVIPDEELFKDISDPMDDFRKAMTDMDIHIGITKEPARIVQVERWKPKKV